MVMENPFEGKEIWFGVGSQDLYGEEALRQVAIHSAEMVDYLNNTGKIPAKIVLKPTLKSSDGVKEFMVEASANPNVIGVITWCHTFSPAKMWIRPRSADQAAAAAGHPAPQGNPVGDHRHGLHEPEPGRPRRP